MEDRYTQIYNLKHLIGQTTEPALRQQYIQELEAVRRQPLPSRDYALTYRCCMTCANVYNDDSCKYKQMCPYISGDDIIYTRYIQA